MTKHVFATFRAVGFHNWPGAPDAYAYLRSKHRHEFHCKVEIAVGGSNREVEFCHFKDVAHGEFIKLCTADGDFGSRSCEMIADDLRAALLHLHYRVSAVEVSEDGENGAVLRWEN